MATVRYQIEHLERLFLKDLDFETPWKIKSKSRKWLKKQMNKYIRRKTKEISEDDKGCKLGKKPYYGWEY